MWKKVKIKSKKNAARKRSLLLRYEWRSPFSVSLTGALWWPPFAAGDGTTTSWRASRRRRSTASRRCVRSTCRTTDWRSSRRCRYSRTSRRWICGTTNSSISATTRLSTRRLTSSARCEWRPLMWKAFLCVAYQTTSNTANFRRIIVVSWIIKIIFEIIF